MHLVFSTEESFACGAPVVVVGNANVSFVGSGFSFRFCGGRTVAGSTVGADEVVDSPDPSVGGKVDSSVPDPSGLVTSVEGAVVSNGSAVGFEVEGIPDSSTASGVDEAEVVGTSGAVAEEVGETPSGADVEDSPDPSGLSGTPASPDPPSGEASEVVGIREVDDSAEDDGVGAGVVGFPSTPEVSPLSPPSTSTRGFLVLFDTSRVVAVISSSPVPDPSIST